MSIAAVRLVCGWLVALVAGCSATEVVRSNAGRQLDARPGASRGLASEKQARATVPRSMRGCAQAADCVALGGCCPCAIHGYVGVNRRHARALRSFRPDCSLARCRQPEGEACAMPGATCHQGLCAVVPR